VLSGYIDTAMHHKKIYPRILWITMWMKG
jgi:hypothetical protein